MHRGPVLFLKLLYRLIKARGGKAGRRTHGRGRDGVCCREIRHAHIEGRKAQQKMARLFIALLEAL